MDEDEACAVMITAMRNLADRLEAQRAPDPPKPAIMPIEEVWTNLAKIDAICAKMRERFGRYAGPRGE